MANALRGSDQEKVIPCRLHLSGFEKADSNFYSLTIVGDGSLYFTLSTHNIDTHGRVYRYDPSRDALTPVCDLGEATGERGAKMLPQGKSHSPFYELDGWLYFSTHYGYFATNDEREEPAPIPDGYKPYPGGHLIRLHMASGRVEDLAKAPPEEGILTLNMDARRGRLYGLTWPKGLFLVYDIATGDLRNLGSVSRGGEVGRGDQYFCLVRSFAIDPRDGRVYFTNADGQVHVYDPDADRVAPLDGVTLRRDILGQWDPHKPGHQGYNWRDILWHEESQCFYGVHPKSGWLFRFDPPARKLDLIERIAADDLRRSGQFEPFRYGYLTLQLGPDRETLYYLTSTYGPDGSGDSLRVQQATHLVTYNLRTGRYDDHGALRLDDGRQVRMSQCHAVHPGGRCYACPWIELPHGNADQRPRWQCDLISFADPLAAARQGR
ncbi:MAG TPA: hypothetical protein PLP01_09460 [Phycisphaerae bacterium]|nr:hypothetical protein [Phycisphaerae bacterium]